MISLLRSFGNVLKPRYIIGAESLAFPHPLPLSTYFGTLAGGLGCFPFDHGSYHP